MKNNTMKRAWEIRRNVAKELNVKVSLVSMSECLKIAWAESRNAINYKEEIHKMDNRLDEHLKNADEKTLKTIYVMLKNGGNVWFKDDKVRVYINNAYNFTSLEKVSVYKPDLWLTKQVRGDYANWKINGVETDTIYTHASSEKEMCAKIEKKDIDISLYFDVVEKKMSWLKYYDSAFNIEKNVANKIQEMVKSL
jgi:hypothetical protein